MPLFAIWPCFLPTDSGVDASNFGILFGLLAVEGVVNNLRPTPAPDPVGGGPWNMGYIEGYLFQLIIF